MNVKEDIVMQKKWRKRLLNYAIIFILVVGLGMLGYTVGGNALNDWRTDQLIAYHNSQKKSAQALKAQIAAQQAALNRDPAAPTHLESLSFESITPEIYEEHLLGEIFLPTIQQHLAIFDNVGEQFFQKGAAWLSTSSTLFGGIGKHSAVAAHSGIPTAKMFSDLHRVKLGDLIIYKLGDDYLAYRIIRKRTVAPNEPQTYAEVADKDLTTLITCTPVGAKYHRLLVTGERVPFQPAMMTLVKQTTAKKQHHTLWVLLSISLILIAALTTLVLVLKNSRRNSSKKV
jgi:sortase A